MTISTTPALSAVQPATRQTTALEAKAAEPPPKKPFEPAPELRPNVQDYVDINRTLRILRQV